MKLSRNFDSAEFMCRCGVCHLAAVSPRLLSALEVLRAKIGGHPVRINSGVRCEAYNRQISGAPHSQHLFGMAADIEVAGMTGDDLYLIARSIGAVRGFGVAGPWLHMDVRYGPVLRWRYDRSGHVVPWPEGVL